MRGLQCGDPIQADDIAIARGNDVVAHLRCDEFTGFRAAIANAAEPAVTLKMIEETTR
jgi:hypothetical protein